MHAATKTAAPTVKLSRTSDGYRLGNFSIVNTKEVSGPAHARVSGGRDWLVSHPSGYSVRLYTLSDVRDALARAAGRTGIYRAWHPAGLERWARWENGEPVAIADTREALS